MYQKERIEMSEFIKNPELCADCPMREGLKGDPGIAVELGWEASGNISADGRTASFEMRYGKPVGDRLSTVAVGSEGDPISDKAVFKVSGRKFDNGDVEKAFKECDSPTERKGGFLWLQTRVGCTAVQRLQGKEL